MLIFPALVNTESLCYADIENIFISFENSYRPVSGQKFPLLFILYGEYLFFCIVLFRFLLTLQRKGALWS